MTTDELRALQAPLKSRYLDDPGAARHTLRARGIIDPAALACRIDAGHGPTIEAGLHPAAGGDGHWACSGDMLLQALAACAGVTLAVVATAMGIPLRSAAVIAEGDLDFRGTLGVSKDVPVGFEAIRVRFEVDTEAGDDPVAKLAKLAERYCVIAQSLKPTPEVAIVRTNDGRAS